MEFLDRYGYVLERDATARIGHGRIETFKLVNSDVQIIVSTRPRLSESDINLPR